MDTSVTLNQTEHHRNNTHILYLRTQLPAHLIQGVQPDIRHSHTGPVGRHLHPVHPCAIPWHLLGPLHRFPSRVLLFTHHRLPRPYKPAEEEEHL